MNPIWIDIVTTEGTTSRRQIDGGGLAGGRRTRTMQMVEWSNRRPWVHRQVYTPQRHHWREEPWRKTARWNHGNAHHLFGEMMKQETLMTLVAAMELQWRLPEVEAGIRRAKVELERLRLEVELATTEGVEGSEWPASPQQKWCDVWSSQSQSTKGAWRGQMPNGHCRSWGRKEWRRRSQSQEEQPQADRWQR